MTQTYKIQLSMNQSHVVNSGFVFKQGDFGFQVQIEVLDFDTSGATAKIIWRKSQGATEGLNLTRSGNTFTYTMQGSELDVPGPGVCDLKLYDSTTRRLSTASFSYYCEADTMDGFEEEAHSYSDTIAQIAAQIQGYADDSEAWAIGTKQGVPVPSTAPQYQNFSQWYVQFAEAWAKGTRNGTPVGSSEPQYNNNSQYFVQFSEAWAKGTRNGSPVASGEPQYHNNAQYFSGDSEAWAKGTSGGAAVPSTAPQYQNHSKWYSKDSEAWAVGKRDGVDVPSGADQFQNNSKWYSGVSQYWAGKTADDVDACQNIYDLLINAMGLGTFSYDASTGDLYYDVASGSMYVFSLSAGNLYVDVVTP